VFTLHAELEGMLLLDAFESLLVKWRDSGASITRMATIHEVAMRRPLPARAVIMGEVAGRSGLLAVQAASAAAPTSAAAQA
jgi:undecaprenyl phosphate-alpha-L-ara4FN deformylase